MGKHQRGILMTKNRINTRRRRSIRLKGYDYSLSGADFVTICVEGGACLLGKVAEDMMLENPAGVMIGDCWHGLSDRFSCVDIDATIVMTNHMHGIILLLGDDRVVMDSAAAAQRAATRAATTLADIVGAFKSITTNDYLLGIREDGWPSFEN